MAPNIVEYLPPPAGQTVTGFIRFQHPKNSNNSSLPGPIFLMLPKVDRNEDAKFGVHHNTALLACQIIADNAFNGYLCEDRDGNVRVTDPGDAILTGMVYFFHVPQKADYPIISTFEDWRFPATLPATWRDATIGNPPTPFRPQACALTGFQITRKTVHLPKSKSDWCEKNMASRHIDPYADITARCNTIWLRLDLQSSYDKGEWTVLPRNGVFTSYSISPRFVEYHAKYHNVGIQNIFDPHTWLFARFAWLILTRVNEQLSRLVDGSLTILVSDPTSGQRVNQPLTRARLKPTKKRPATGNSSAAQKRACNSSNMAEADSCQWESDESDESDSSPWQSKEMFPYNWDSSETELSASDTGYDY